MYKHRVALLRLMRVSVDRERQVVRAGLLGFIGDGLAVARRHRLRRSTDGKLEFAMHVGSVPPPPDAHAARPSPHPCLRQPHAARPSSTGTVLTLAPALALAPALTLVQTLTSARTQDRADPGPRERGPGAACGRQHRCDSAALNRLLATTLSPDPACAPSSLSITAASWQSATPQAFPRRRRCSLVMTKSVVAGLVGVLVKEGRLALDQSAGWSRPTAAASAFGRRPARHVERLALQ